ncbi:hypothetical protein B0H11DRAFT_2304323 [Mycena galericulata]|nr:hypothetical protein B0H11DRAFT_2184882 [Mycena galericulata]KAJ7508416.1 hypothetical protein B0H11DRAFT_2304323 [Mycena galericulata]
MAHPFAPLDPGDDELARYQKNSTELVVYCRPLSQAVTISWPAHNGVKIVPTGIRPWLRNRGLFLECFCGFRSALNEPRSCQIVESQVSGDVLAFCHFDHPRCGFKVNLSYVYRHSILKSSYAHLPSLKSGGTPDMDTWVVAHLLHVSDAVDICPHFEGYGGEHKSQYPTGTQQLSGPLLVHVPKKKSHTGGRRHSAPYALDQLRAPRSNRRYLEIDDHYPQAAEAADRLAAPGPASSISAPGPSRTQVLRPVGTKSATGGSSWAKRDIRYLRDLADGKGISEWSWVGLVEQCQSVLISSLFLVKSHNGTTRRSSINLGDRG